MVGEEGVVGEKVGEEGMVAVVVVTGLRWMEAVSGHQLEQKPGQGHCHRSLDAQGLSY